MAQGWVCQLNLHKFTHILHFAGREMSFLPGDADAPFPSPSKATNFTATASGQAHESDRMNTKHLGKRMKAIAWEQNFPPLPEPRKNRKRQSQSEIKAIPSFSQFILERLTVSARNNAEPKQVSSNLQQVSGNLLATISQTYKPEMGKNCQN